jgi:Tfp pilus assembly protein PilV
MQLTPTRPRGSRRAGFTIFEVMMSTAILSLAIATSVTTLQRGYANLDSARNMVLAGQIMQTEIEKLRMSDWATVYAYADNTDTTATVDSVFTSNAAIGNRFTMIRRCSTPQTGMKQITFTITWRNFDGRSLSRSYTTYYCQNGLYDFFFNN